MFFDDSWGFVGSTGSIRSMSARRTRTRTTVASNRNTYAQDLIRDVTFDDTPDVDQVGLGRRAHVQGRTSPTAATARCRRAPRRNFIGLFTFPTDATLQRRRRRRPIRSASGSAWASSTSTQIDHRRGSAYPGQVGGQQPADAEPRRALRLAGATPSRQDAIGPRLGFAYDVDRRWQDAHPRRRSARSINITQTRRSCSTLQQRAVIAPTLAYDTAQVTSPADRPARSR